MKSLSCIMAALIFCSISFAQPGNLDPTFNSTDAGFGIGDGVYPFPTSNSVEITAIQPDGKILVGGNFPTFHASPKANLIRLNSDGSIDPTFNVGGIGPNGSVRAIVLELNTDGTLKAIIIGGAFTQYNGQSRLYIARLSPNGSTDPTFTQNSLNGPVLALALQIETSPVAQTRILVGGQFTAPRTRIMRLINSNGSVDTNFSSAASANGDVHAILHQTSGNRIIIAGNFTSVNGASVSRVARFESGGTLDITGFNNATGANGLVSTLAIHNDGNIWIGGSFTSYRGNLVGRYCMISSTNGSLVFTPNQLAANDNVNIIRVFSDGKIAIGGSFSLIGVIPSSRFIVLSSSLQAMEMFVGGFSGPSGTSVRSVSVYNDGTNRVLVGGNFQSLVITGGSKAHTPMLVRLTRDGLNNGTPDPQWKLIKGAGGAITASFVQNDGKILLAGRFYGYNDKYKSRVIRVNPNGSLDQTFDVGNGPLPAESSDVFAIATDASGKIYVGGSFNGFGASSLRGIVRLNSDGTVDATYNSGGVGVDVVPATPSLARAVRAIKPISDGSVIIGGDFTTYNGSPMNYLARLNQNGTLATGATIWNPGSGPNGPVYALSVDFGINIGGDFTAYNGTSTSRFARLGVNGTLSNVFTGIDGRVNSIQTFDNKVYAAGAFSNFNGSARNRLARVNITGTVGLDLSYNPPLLGSATTIESIAIHSTSGKLYLTSTNSAQISRVDRLLSDGTVDPSFNTVSTINAQNIINKIEVLTNSDIIVSGNFLSLNGVGKNRIAKVLGDPYTKVQSPYCGSTVEIASAILCDPVLSAQDYEWEISNSLIPYYTTYVRGNASNDFSLNWVSGIQSNTAYEIRVRARVGGIWGAFGTICTITTAASGGGGGEECPDPNNPNCPCTGPFCARIRSDNSQSGQTTESTLHPGIYPNPTKDSFTLILSEYSKEATSVRIYDVNGRLLVNSTLAKGSIKEVINLGDASPGMYIVCYLDNNIPTYTRLVVKE